MTHLKTLSLIISTLFFVACGEQASSVNEETTTQTERSISSEKKDSTELLTITQEEILTAINEARAIARDCHDGLGWVEAVEPLSWNSELYAAAYEHSNDMAQSNTFSHIGSATSTDVTGSNRGTASKFNERIKANGYVNYRTAGENIAGGQESIQEAMKAWLASPAHCTNIMNPNFSEVGVSVVLNDDSKFGIYWTQNFGSRR
jgi:uncharacterized protein YkwD